MNYIQGSRYQMYCEAREVGVRTCTLFVATPPEQCRERNAARDETSAYLPATLDNLISRFEEPNSAARWDAPLITVAADDPPLDQRGESADAGAHRSEAAKQIWRAITEGAQAAESGDSNYPDLLDLLPQPPRLDLDSTSTLLIAALLSHQSLSPFSGPTPLTLPTSPAPTRITLELNRPVTMPQLQRLKRQFTEGNLNARTAITHNFRVQEVVELFPLDRLLQEHLQCLTTSLSSQLGGQPHKVTQGKNVKLS